MDKVYNILLNVRNGVDYTAHKTLFDDGVLDSFDIVTLIAEINEVFDVQVPAEEIIPENFNSAAAIHAMVERLKT
jgi:acyl carrier protein